MHTENYASVPSSEVLKTHICYSVTLSPGSSLHM